MNTLRLGKSVLFITALTAYILIVGYIRDNVVSPQHKIWVNLTSIGILVLAIIVNLTYKERSDNKPNYKMYFFGTLIIFLYSMILIVISKR